MQCKVPKTNEDLKGASYYQWDAVAVNGRKLDVYSIIGFPHSIGGRMGVNELYCCPRGEKLSIDNIMCFSGESCNFDLSFESKNYHKSKWDEDRIEHIYKCTIFRNKNPFYTLSSHKLDYLMAKAHILLIEIGEHAVPFHFINYEKEIINRRIMWKNTPCIIIDYFINNNLIIVPDFNEISPEEFIKITKLDREYYDSNDYSFPEDLFAKSINWFRD